MEHRWVFLPLRLQRSKAASSQLGLGGGVFGILTACECLRGTARGIGRVELGGFCPEGRQPRRRLALWACAVIAPRSFSLAEPPGLRLCWPVVVPGAASPASPPDCRERWRFAPLPPRLLPPPPLSPAATPAPTTFVQGDHA